MTLITIFLWLANIFLDTIGQLAFKAGAIAQNNHQGVRYWLVLMQNPWILLGVICYIGEFFIWLAFLSLVPLSEGVLLGSINIVVIMIAGRFFFKERLSKLRLTGILFVTLGVTLVGIFP